MRVTFEQAMQSKEAAQIYLRDTKEVSAGEKCQLADKYGADFLTRALSADGTDYEIDDVSYDAAKQAGEDSAKKSTGYDGGKTGAAVVDTVITAGAHIAGQTVVKKAVAPIVDKLTTGSVQKAQNAGKAVKGNGTNQASFIIGCTMGLAEALKYRADKPNEEQVEAAVKLMQDDFQEGQALLAETQDEMEETAQKVVELTEEAEEKTVETNEKIQTDKTNFDILKGQYQAAKAAKESGRKLTPDEEAILKNNAAQMQDLGECINATTEETSDDVNDINDTIGDFQDVYDDSAESIANVDGVTSFAENFDENTRTMCYVEAVGQTINATVSGASASKAGRFAASGGWFTAWAWAFAAMGTTGAYFSAKGAKEQYDWAGVMTEEINARGDLQDLTEETNEIYEEKLDDYAGSIDFIEDDLEIVVPEDLTVPEPTTIPKNQSPAVNNANLPANNSTVDNNKKDDKKDDNKKDDKK